MTVILITGPSRSGKSEWAEQLATRRSQAVRGEVIYVATAMANAEDAEWCDRIQKHIQRRPAHWQTHEIPIELAAFIKQINGQVNDQQLLASTAQNTPCILIDSLGTWLANLIEQDDEPWEIVQTALLSALSQTSALVILVAEETGWGVVPAYELGRRFRDRLGALSRAIGELAEDVYLVTSGYALNLSTLGESVAKEAVTQEAGTKEAGANPSITPS